MAFTKSRRRRAPSTPPPEVAAGMTPVHRKDYKGGYTAEDAHSTGHSAGERDLHRATVHGTANAKRAQGRFPRLLVAGYNIQIETIGASMNAALLSGRQRLAMLAVEVPVAEQGAVESTETHFEERRRVKVLEHEIRLLGLHLPHGVSLVILVAALVALFVADFTMLPISFSPLNLSDEKMLGLPFLTELHLAASGVVAGLIVLAHRAAAEARTILHERALERRTPADRRAGLAPKDVDAPKLLALWVVAAFLLLAGVTLLRVSYLDAIGQPTNVLEFLAVNLGLYGASFSSSLWFAHPKTKEYRTAQWRARWSGWAMGRRITAYGELVSEHNAILEDQGTIEARALHEAFAAGYDTHAMQDVQELGVLHGQHEPTEDPLFEKDPALPTGPTEKELLVLLRRGAQVVDYVPLDTTKVQSLRTTLQADLTALVARLERRPPTLIGTVDPYGPDEAQETVSADGHVRTSHEAPPAEQVRRNGAGSART